MLDKIRLLALKADMDERLMVKPGLKYNVRLFSEPLKTDAWACQAFGQPVCVVDEVNATRGRADGHPQKGSATGKSKPEDGHESPAPSLVCLGLSHRETLIKHKIKDCRACPEKKRSNSFNIYPTEKQ